MDAHVFVMMYLKERNLSEIDEISKGYNQAFASSVTDGVRAMALHFADTSYGARCSRRRLSSCMTLRQWIQRQDLRTSLSGKRFFP